MFYEDEKPDKILRLGDIIKGYVVSTPKIDKPINDIQNINYSLNVDLPCFSVVLTPCCSISDKKITIAPLTKALVSFFDNPYFSEDLTRINRKMDPQNAYPPYVWEQFTEEIRQSRLAVGKAYSSVEVFIYESHPLLPIYTLKTKKGTFIETNYYMVDFKDAYRIDCELIIRPEKAILNPKFSVISDSKYMQLSISARSELRDKISAYYSRIPDEDKIEVLY